MPKIIEVDPDILKRYISSKFMPNTNSAIRRVRRVAKQTTVNRLRKSKYRAAIKKMEDLIKTGEKDKIKNYFNDFQSILMKVAKTGAINKKTASNKISKISKKIKN
jgi:small subunit ribosomal protein S20